MKHGTFFFAFVGLMLGILGGAIGVQYISDAQAQAVRRVEIFSETADQASIADQAEGANDITAVGAELGDACYGSVGVDTVDLVIGCAITAADTCTLTFANVTAGAVDLASTTHRCFLFRVD